MLIGLKTLRVSAQKTQEELAANVGVSQSYYNELERGVKCNPTYQVVAALAAALDCTIEDLFQETKIDHTA